MNVVVKINFFDKYLRLITVYHKLNFAEIVNINNKTIIPRLDIIKININIYQYINDTAIMKNPLLHIGIV